MERIEGATKEKLSLEHNTNTEKENLVVFLDDFIRLLEDSAPDGEDAGQSGGTISPKGHAMLKETLQTTSITANKTTDGSQAGSPFDTKISDIFKTLKLVLEKQRSGRQLEDKTISTAMREMAEQQNKQPSCVSSECTRGLNKISSAQFYEYVKEFIAGNPDPLVDQIIAANKNKRISPDMIRTQFSSLLSTV